jgi:drug/metabolite transporter (DMT)-like permease
MTETMIKFDYICTLNQLMESDHQSGAYLKIHLAVLLFGFTAILGNLIQLPAIMIVWWRVLLTSISLLFFIGFGKTLRDLPQTLIKKYVLIGIVIGLHWICFYGSVKLSNASICLVCMSTTSFFTSLIEPLVVRKKINYIEMLIGAMIIPGMILIVNNLDISYYYGIVVGLLSALLAAVFSTMNKANIKGADPYTISFIELSGAWVMNVFGYSQQAFLPPTISDWVWLFVLALFCTTLAHVLTLKALQHISVFASNLVINLEPVYGILLAIFILKEHKELNTMFYIGTAIILFSIFTYPMIQKYTQKPA